MRDPVDCATEAEAAEWRERRELLSDEEPAAKRERRALRERGARDTWLLREKREGESRTKKDAPAKRDVTRACPNIWDTQDASRMRLARERERLISGHSQRETDTNVCE